MRCICKENHWNNFSKGSIYYYREEFSMGGFSQVFLIRNDRNNVHAFDLEHFNRYFITEKENRKLKLDKINERQGNL